MPRMTSAPYVYTPGEPKAAFDIEIVDGEPLARVKSLCAGHVIMAYLSIGELTSFGVLAIQAAALLQDREQRAADVKAIISPVGIRQ